MVLRRVNDLPQYVFSRIDELKAEAAARGTGVAATVMSAFDASCAAMISRKSMAYS